MGHAQTQSFAEAWGFAADWLGLDPSSGGRLPNFGLDLSRNSSGSPRLAPEAGGGIVGAIQTAAPGEGA